MHVGIQWFISVSAILFGIGMYGVFTRRSPLILLLSVEIMLNACNLALIAFSRYQGEQSGQVFALVVMAVAASEVVVGLGLIVAMGLKMAASRRLRSPMAIFAVAAFVGIALVRMPLGTFLLIAAPVSVAAAAWRRR